MCFVFRCWATNKTVLPRTLVTKSSFSNPIETRLQILLKMSAERLGNTDSIHQASTACEEVTENEGIHRSSGLHPGSLITVQTSTKSIAVEQTASVSTSYELLSASSNQEVATSTETHNDFMNTGGDTVGSTQTEVHDSESWEDIFDIPMSRSFNNRVVYHHKVRRGATMKTGKARRKEYLKQKSQGSLLTMGFTGSHSTQFWKQYGIETHDDVEDGNVHSITSILTQEELNKMGPMERRLHINGQKLAVVSNSSATHSLYEAIGHALRFRNNPSTIRSVILNQLYDNWGFFCNDVCEVCSRVESILEVKPELMDPRETLLKYKSITTKNASAPLFELTAAAYHFGFTYSILELNSNLENPYIQVKNCKHEAINGRSKVKYIFLKTENNSDSGYYELLVPIGPLSEIPDGTYECKFRDVVLVECTHSPRKVKPKYYSDVGRVPVGFAVDHRIFLYRSTISHDLWSLLAELMFKKLMHAPEIKQTITENKHDNVLFYLACKAKKRYMLTGNASLEKVVKEFEKRFSFENPRGDIEDLHHAASEYKFSYTIIGTDVRGNFFWKDCPCRKYPGGSEPPYLSFFVKTAPDNTTFWYALEDIGQYCPKEQRLYKDVQFGDLRLWKGRFYFHSLPDRSSSVGSFHSTFLWDSVTDTATDSSLSDTKTWLMTSLAKLNEKIRNAVSSVRILPRSRSLFQSLVRMLRSRRVSNELIFKRSDPFFNRDRP